MPDQAAMDGTSPSIIGPIDFRRAEAEEFLPGGASFTQAEGYEIRSERV